MFINVYFTVLNDWFSYIIDKIWIQDVVTVECEENISA